MTTSPPTPVVHLELHTGDLPRARALCANLCGWRAVIATREAGEIAPWQQKGWRL